MIGGINMERIIEIRAAAGGRDSQLFVYDLAIAFGRMADRLG